MNLDTTRLKLYIPPHTKPGEGEHAAPLHDCTNKKFLIETDKYVVETVLDHKPKPATCGENRSGL